ncbi:hypothetical protein A3K24_01530 [candidate division Kazan bacterium RIFCSPHIGHO2_01_FULL_44_14]|uniref:DUF5667 domain-containing protein n=1 Tax=candidate division Kazan bacterium RIFCSPLOWO2_01_FULL_45_19 TaxID=1798538 RepID=A0A1F4NQF8_UNCK3|nr:hypothetical protein [uncultured bacterium]OGB73517.1 MAG: hypothetical protein A3K51_01530 [candidate division Kazan bacterium RIFCSPLOWO2_01_FULL_45_19]OGB77762.1 MAG: hypothetical protein A3K24_01530 [candidate division Kazan bacterium RIFCSPHIGHO2_01_FULL_44_14]
MPRIHDNLVQELGVLGKDAHLSLSQRQKIRDRLFKQIGQLDLIDAMQTKVETADLVMPVNKLANIFRPQKIMLGLPATVGLLATVFVATFTTGAIANDAQPGQPLFGVRKAFENVEIALTTDPARRATLRLAIADDRLKALGSSDQAQLSDVVRESQLALENARSAVTALQNSSGDATTSADLVNKLKSFVDAQRGVLKTIIDGNIGKDDVRQSILAMRDDLEKLIPAVSATPATGDTTPATPKVVTDGSVMLVGNIGTYTAKPTLMIGSTRYFLVGSAVNLIPYMGSTNATVFGVLEGDTIQLSKLLIGGQVIWDTNIINSPLIGETPGKNDNNLPRVEGDQNQSFEQISN